MKNHINHLVETAKASCNRGMTRAYLSTQALRRKLTQQDGQFVMDHAVVFVLIIVLGGIALVLLTTYLQNELSTTLKAKINDFFK